MRWAVGTIAADRNAAVVLFHGRFGITTTQIAMFSSPRFWASLLYSLRAGMNFPLLILQLDELGEGPGCTAHTERVGLGAYELAIKQATQLSERTHDLGTRMLAKWRERSRDAPAQSW